MLGEPRASVPRRAVEASSRARRRQRPRQRRLVDLARGAGGQLVDDGEQRDDGGGQLLGEACTGGPLVEAGPVGHGEVADEHLVAGVGALRTATAAPVTPGQRLQGGLDLAELDAATADLHLVVGAALEDEAGAVELHEVAAAVGALPAEARQRGVLLGVLGRVEVAGEPDSADDEFADLALGDRVAVGVDHGELPAVEGQADAHGHGSVEQGGAGHDGGLGRSVGVPDLALGRRRAARRARAGRPRRRR